MSSIAQVEKDVKELKADISKRFESLSHALQQRSGGANQNLENKVDKLLEMAARSEINQERIETKQDETNIELGKVVARVESLEIKEQARIIREQAKEKAEDRQYRNEKAKIERTREIRRNVLTVFGTVISLVAATFIFMELSTNGTFAKWGFLV